jgi:hypothetical protein
MFYPHRVNFFPFTRLVTLLGFSHTHFLYLESLLPQLSPLVLLPLPSGHASAWKPLREAPGVCGVNPCGAQTSGTGLDHLVTWYRIVVSETYTKMSPCGFFLSLSYFSWSWFFASLPYFLFQI